MLSLKNKSIHNLNDQRIYAQQMNILLLAPLFSASVIWITTFLQKIQRDDTGIPLPISYFTMQVFVFIMILFFIWALYVRIKKENRTKVLQKLMFAKEVTNLITIVSITTVGTVARGTVVLPYYTDHFFFTLLGVCLIYFIIYLGKYRKIATGRKGTNYIKQMEKHGWTHYVTNVTVFRTKKSNLSIDNQLINIIATFFIRFWWLVGVIIYVAANGKLVDNFGDVFPLVIVLMSFLVMPFFGKSLAQSWVFYRFIVRVEKEYGVTIQNASWDDYKVEIGL